MSKEEKVDVDILVIALVSLVNHGINGLDLLEVFFQRRIQPLQARAHPMWQYSGPSDPTRTHPEELSEEAVANKLKATTPARDNPRGTRRVPPYSIENPVNEVNPECHYCFRVMRLSFTKS